VLSSLFRLRAVGFQVFYGAIRDRFVDLIDEQSSTVQAGPLQ
jgi:hypothetical protein